MVDEQQHSNKRLPSQLVCPKIEDVGGIYCGMTSTDLTEIDGNIYNNQITFSGHNAQLQNLSQCEILSTTTINQEIVNNNNIQQPSSTNCLSTQNLAHQQNIQPNISSNSTEKNNTGGSSLTCTVCGDVATGRHYGSVACNGCKGFFRRTIRRNYKYTCRFNSNCQIDKHNRAVCRACRYARCIMFGMKVDAVQSERDLIGKRSRYSSASGTPGPSLIPSTSSPQSIQHQQSLEEERQHSPKDEQIHHQQTQQIVQQLQTQNILSTSSQQSVDGGIIHPTTIPLTIQQTSNSSQFCDTTEEAISRKRSLSSGNHYEQIKPARRNFSTNKSIPSHILTTTSEQINQILPQSELNSIVENADPWSGQNGRALLRHLLCSEEKISNMRETVVAHACTLQYSTRGSKFPFTGDGTRKASENDILQSLHTQLLLVIEWAKTLKPFADLPTEDQTALLKNFAAQHVVLCVAYRSTTDFLKLINDSCIPRVVNGAEKDLFYRRDAERVMDMLVSPMRFLRMDDVEFVALKACILFNPVARGLSSNSVMSILQTRRHIFRALQNYVRAKAPNDEDRIGDLTFFVLSPLQSLAKAVSEDVLVSKITGIARLDQLMEELMLEGWGDLDLKEMSMENDSNQVEEPNSSSAQQHHQQEEEEQNLINIQENINSSNTTTISAPINNHSQSTKQWGSLGTIHPNSPKQRGRNVSSASDSSQATSSSSGSPNQTFLQPVPGTPSPYSAVGITTTTTGVSESEFSSSALSSYVFGNSLSCNNYMQPPFAWNSSVIQSNDICFTSDNSTTSTKLISQTSPNSSSSFNAPPPQYYNSENVHYYTSHSNTQQTQEERTLQRGEINNQLINQQPNCAWGVINTQMQHNFVPTPSTPIPAIYSGTSPSPPQRFGIGGVGGGAR